MEKTEMNKLGFGEMLTLAKLKREKPKEYQQVMKDMEGVFIDFMKMMMRVAEKVGEKDEEFENKGTYY